MTAAGAASAIQWSGRTSSALHDRADVAQERGPYLGGHPGARALDDPSLRPTGNAAAELQWGEAESVERLHADSGGGSSRQAVGAAAS